MDKATILVVEDEVIIAMEIENCLQKFGYSVLSTCGSGEEALRRIERDKPDLVLMDIRIKGELDGIETAERIRNEYGIPVVFSTAYLDEDRIQRAKFTMPFGYVLKPIQERDLKVTIEMALYVSKTDRARRKIEAELKKSEERFRLAMEVTIDGLFDWNIRTNEIYFSPGYFTMLGYLEDDLRHTFETYQRLIHPDDFYRVETNLTNYLEGRKAENGIEVRLKTKSGHWIWVLSRGRVVDWDENGQPTRMIGTNVNIDERKRMEELLKSEKAKSQQYLDVAGVMMMAVDSSGEVLLVNPKGAEILGYPSQEIVGCDWFEKFLLPEHYDEVKGAFNQLISGDAKLVEYNESPIVRKDGSQRDIAWHNSALLDNTGKTVGMFCSGEDITDRNLVYKELEKTSLMIQSISDAVITTDLKGNITFWNHGAEQVYGYSESEILGKPIEKLFGKENGEELASMLTKLMNGEETTNFEISFVNKAGSVVYTLMSLTTIKNDDGAIVEFVGFTKDISEKKHAEAALRQSEKRYRMTIDHFGDVIHVVDRDFNILLINLLARRQFENLGLGAEIIGKNLFQLVPYITEKVQSEYRQVMKTRQTLITEDVFDIEGKPFYAETRKIPVVLENQVESLITVVRDITDRKITEVAKVNHVKRYRRLFENHCDAIYLLSEEGKILDANQAACDALGRTFDEIVSMSIQDVDSNFSQEAFKLFWKDHPEEKTLVFESVHRRADQSTFPVELVGLPFFEDGKRFLYGFAKDISDRKK